MSPGEETSTSRAPEWITAGAVACVAAVMVIYARTFAFAWDEGYHLVAAWLIAHGKQPYIDFVFPQTPLNAYWNSILLRVFGESWRVPHTVASVLTVVAVAMVTAWVFRRTEAPRAWRAACAIAAAVFFGFNTAIMDFHSLQAYGLSLIAGVVALFVTMSAVDRPSILRPFGAGVGAGIAAASSLLTAPTGPVLLVWMLIVNRAGSRIAKAAVFIAGFAIPFIPLLRLLMESPHNVIFGFLQYQLLYRKVEWEGATMHNIGEVLSWGDSSQGVLMVLLAAAAVLYLRRSNTPRPLKAELCLCAALAVCIGAWLLVARPTFTRYYLFTVPYLSILASRGLYEVSVRLAGKPRAAVWAGILCFILCWGLASTVFGERDDMMWGDVEKTAAKVQSVTPPEASLLADEVVYFQLRRQPPSGMELEDSHKLNFEGAEAMRLHLVSRPKLDLMIKAGRFDTVEMCDDDEIDRLDLASLYSKKATVGSCKVFWSRVTLPTDFRRAQTAARAGSPN
ncbi:MAG TPA: hypothetical protein VHA14_13725 [Bryobacteraceae bacterium]|nr:hypothetical protein [Bryobacteraceae bacterium]